MKLDTFREAWLDSDKVELLKKIDLMPDAIWQNDTYEVWVRTRPVPGWTDMIWLSIKRRDKQPIDKDRWRILQRIKNELVGPENEGMEMYPAESRLVDTSNQYHLWCFVSPQYRFPFGFNERMVSECSSHGATQAPWDDDDRPADLKDEYLKQKMTEIGVKG